MVVHGDDFTVAGCADDLDLLSEKTEREARAGAESKNGTCPRQLC